MLRHTTQPAESENKKITGTVSANTASGTTCGAKGRKRLNPHALACRAIIRGKRTSHGGSGAPLPICRRDLSSADSVDIGFHSFRRGSWALLSEQEGGGLELDHPSASRM